MSERSEKFRTRTGSFHLGLASRDTRSRSRRVLPFHAKHFHGLARRRFRGIASIPSWRTGGRRRFGHVDVALAFAFDHGTVPRRAQQRSYVGHPRRHLGKSGEGEREGKQQRKEEKKETRRLTVPGRRRAVMLSVDMPSFVPGETGSLRSGSARKTISSDSSSTISMCPETRISADSLIRTAGTGRGFFGRSIYKPMADFSRNKAGVAAREQFICRLFGSHGIDKALTVLDEGTA